jgi:anti-sigma B factor antagonist
VTVLPGPDEQTMTLVCDTCGHAINAIECRPEHWPVVWAVISRTGWSGSRLAIGPHRCPYCDGAADRPGSTAHDHAHREG